MKLKRNDNRYQESPRPDPSAFKVWVTMVTKRSSCAFVKGQLWASDGDREHPKDKRVKK